MKKLFVLLFSLLIFTSCLTTKGLYVNYEIIKLTPDHVGKNNKPESYDAVIKIRDNYYTALLTDKLILIYIGDHLGNEKDYNALEDAPFNN